MLRHLQGKGTKAAIVTRERNLRFKFKDPRLRRGLRSPTIPQSPPSPMPVDHNDHLPAIGDDMATSEHVSSASCTTTATNVGKGEAVLEVRSTKDNEDDGDDNDEAYPGSRTSVDNDIFDGWGHYLEEEDGPMDDDLVEPRFQGMSAADILAEEFEAEAARRGTCVKVDVFHHRLTKNAGYHLSEDDMTTIRAHNFKVDTDIGANTFEKLPRAFPELRDISSLQKLRTRVTFLSGVKPVVYDCCKNSCVCFTGAFEKLEKCPHCDEARYKPGGGPQNTFSYIPLIPRLVNLFLDEDTVNTMNYRSSYEHQPGTTADVFDSEHYRHLLRTRVTIEGEELPHRFFSQPTDIALGLSTDGFGPFKRRKQSCWPLLLFNYNLPPDVRFRLANVICLGVIPGPKQPKDTDSFLLPFVEECLQLEKGVPAFDKRSMQRFMLHVYLLLVFGDMPAIAKLMRMKGHNGYRPCRACEIVGISDPGSTNKTYYTPLHRSGTGSYDPLHLPLRTHDQFMRQACEVASASTGAEEGRRGTHCGIAGVPMLSKLSSISFPTSFPHDFMHLMFENVVKSLVTIWTEDYKGLDSGKEDYVIPKNVWESIGSACSSSGDTIPAAFGCRVPNIESQRHYFISESWLLFATLLGPILLKRRFTKEIYYQHFTDLVKLINMCLQMRLSTTDIDKIESGFAQWVLQFERPVNFASNPMKIY